MGFLRFILVGLSIFIYVYGNLACVTSNKVNHNYLNNKINFFQAGYQLKITNFKKCIKDQLFDLSANTTLVINDNCELILDSCIKVKSFKTAVVSYDNLLNLKKIKIQFIAEQSQCV